MKIESNYRSSSASETANENIPPTEVLVEQIEALSAEVQQYHCPPESDRVLSKEEHDAAEAAAKKLYQAQRSLRAVAEAT